MKIGPDECVRYYDKNGNHVFSILMCVDDPYTNVDFAALDGEVVWCGPSDASIVNLLVRDDLIEPIKPLRRHLNLK